MLIMSREVGDRKVAEGPENRIIADPKNIGPLRRLLRSGEADHEILVSHGIDDEMAKALRAGEVNDFLTLRRNLLARIEACFVEELGMTAPHEGAKGTGGDSSFVAESRGALTDEHAGALPAFFGEELVEETDCPRWWDFQCFWMSWSMMTMRGSLTSSG